MMTMVMNNDDNDNILLKIELLRKICSGVKQLRLLITSLGEKKSRS